ncbi:MAG: hypothetical protein A3E01_10075 [Gammaproteobacteria bacterium RIFCSPHIGHO2_12_FULL_63_22]|nr:MAG: hypothetical protein A3E01_10075 [Gammaproteobacteria bacterium RIFCSPHIGHO2_12_FULL_63_22]
MASDSLLDEIDAFLSRPGVSLTETAFGLRAVNDGKFIGEIRKGRRVWPETAARVRKFIAGYQAATIKPPKPRRAA